MLELDPDALLTTTRTVRKRLDFERSVSRELIQECLEIAFQAPNGGNMNSWRWIVIDDPSLVAKAAQLYNAGIDDYIATFGDAGYPGAHVPGADRIAASTEHLRANLHRSPALLLPLFAGRPEGANVFYQASLWGSILQAVWSFMLALRARGLGSAWTTAHLWREAELAELLGFSAEHYTQVGLFPIAYTIGSDFKPAYRKPAAEVVGWNAMP
jgi:nitroreductase